MSATLEYTEALVQSIADSANAMAEWRNQGLVLALSDNKRQFAIGDWLLAGEERWQKKAYREAAAIFRGCKHQTLKQYAHVARAVPACIRMHDVPWSFHQLVARFQGRQEIQRNLLAESVGLQREEFRDLINKRYPAGNSPTLAGRFTAPPFSILDTKQGHWQNRQRAWKALGIRGAEGRGAEHKSVYGLNIRELGGEEISVQNASLAETVYEWFAPKGGGGHILDPFAGGPTRGVVAAKLGHQYTGIELRAGQVEENRRQAAAIGVSPTWVTGDSAKLADHVGDQKFDLIFTCPPYFDLERYTETHPQDLSQCDTYEAFMLLYEFVFNQAVARLKDTGFLVVVVGEIRDKQGFYRNFVGDTISCFLRLGLHYYNELILATPIGTCPLRDGRPFAHYRKVHKVHQNVLCFFKGDDPKRIPTALGVLSLPEGEDKQLTAVHAKAAA